MKLQSSDTYGGDAKPGALVVGIPATGVEKIRFFIFRAFHSRSASPPPTPPPEGDIILFSSLRLKKEWQKHLTNK
jgi:hypothetical protein